MKNNSFCLNIIREFEKEVDWEGISEIRGLPEEFIKEFQHKVHWENICRSQILSEKFIREHKDKVIWQSISMFQILSEDFIREFEKEVDWGLISCFQILSESFIREFMYKTGNLVNFWEKCRIFTYQKLSESFIKELDKKGYIGYFWPRISETQVLSEDFIQEFKHKVDWRAISKCQVLSESFIEKFKERVDWDLIPKYQVLSEPFIEKFKDRLSLSILVKNQKLPKDFIFRNYLCYNWLYKSFEEKLSLVKKCGLYEVVDNSFIIAYKSVRNNRHSLHKLNSYKYEDGKAYTSARCDCDSSNNDSFGLTAWNKEGAKLYYNKGLILKVLINIKDLGCISARGMIRCFKLKVIGIEK